LDYLEAAAEWLHTTEIRQIREIRVQINISYGLLHTAIGVNPLDSRF
jgi:hypothetical protein